MESRLQGIGAVQSVWHLIGYPNLGTWFIYSLPNYTYVEYY